MQTGRYSALQQVVVVIVDKSCAAWRFFADDPERVASITSRTWATVNP
jgi:hypothetical protein